MMRLRGAAAGVLLSAIACASMPRGEGTPSIPGVRVSAATQSTVPAPALPRFWYDPAIPLGLARADSLLNQNGSPRITDLTHWDRFWRDIAPALRDWSADPRLRLNPNFVAALMAKESGFDPRATSDVPANGIAQFTHIADADLQIISRETQTFRWMHDEVRRWPRTAAVHDSLARKGRTDSLLARGLVTPRTEYLFEPRLALRASMFWLRILATTFTEDEWPGEYGTLMRTKLAGGGRLSEQDLLSLVTVAYNQGHPYVADLVKRYGREWTRHLNAESSDYLERITHYTSVFQRGGR